MICHSETVVVLKSDSALNEGNVGSRSRISLLKEGHTGSRSRIFILKEVHAGSRSRWRGMPDQDQEGGTCRIKIKNLYLIMNLEDIVVCLA